ncbi:hypothetical protein [Roseomonas sp. KE2513]|uniref:hypothetical protein n=1 Tax=Roseomonas sp. KE2513 TaxID=2479202 RepID=UPI0018E00902|nr:hypothetical protein [Roseomonas sp. KE2513]
MRTSLATTVGTLALAATLVAPAFAQQGNTSNPGSQGTTGGAPAMTMAPATQAPGGTAAPGTTTGPAASQTRPGTATQGNAGGVPGGATIDTNRQSATRGDNSGNAPATTSTPAQGANSFTEGQARSRIEAAGYTGVQELKKDESGVWRGRAMRGGQTADVGLDYQGNVVTGAAPAR